MSNSFKLCVFISGSGSNLDSIIKKQALYNYEVALVISNKADAKGLDYAKNANIPIFTFNWNKNDKDLTFVQDQIKQHYCDLIVLAGFMRILPEGFISAFENNIINIHPSLLPKYKGLHTHQQVIENKDKIHGASVHFVNAELDGGKIISQTTIAVENNDTAETLAARLLFREHSLLPYTIALIGQNRVQWQNTTLYFDHKKLINPIIIND
jgi:phosphoribosylglycinamide formyltransferase-1